MCLGVPGKILSVGENSLGVRMGRVSFAGVTKEVCLEYAPEAGAGDYVIVHVGFAIGRLDEAEARRVFDLLAEMGELAELGAAVARAGSEARNVEGSRGPDRFRQDSRATHEGSHACAPDAATEPTGRTASEHSTTPPVRPQGARGVREAPAREEPA